MNGNDNLFEKQSVVYRLMFMAVSTLANLLHKTRTVIINVEGGVSTSYSM